jgi:ribose transport system substrate-binding protein
MEKRTAYRARMTRVMAVTAVVAALGVVACGDDSSDEASSASSGGSSEKAAPPKPITAEILGLTGELKCGAGETGDDPCQAPGAVPEGEPVKIGFFCLENDSYSAGQSAKIKEIAEANNATVKDVLNPFNPAQQARQLQDALTANQYGAYIVCPGNPAALKPSYTQMVNKKIPFVTIDFINGTDNATAKLQIEGQALQVIKPPEVAGEAIGGNTVAACGEKPCKVAAIRGIKSLPYDTALWDGFNKVIADHPNIDVVTTVFGDFSVAGGRRSAQDILTAHPDVNVIAGFNDQMGLGAYPVVEKAGKLDSIKVLGNAGSEGAVKAVREGKLFGTSAQVPLSEATMATIAVLAKARGVEFPPLGVDSTSILGDVPTLLNQENLDDWKDFQPQWSGA